MKGEKCLSFPYRLVWKEQMKDANFFFVFFCGYSFYSLFWCLIWLWGKQIVELFREDAAIVSIQVSVEGEGLSNLQLKGSLWERRSSLILVPI